MSTFNFDPELLFRRRRPRVVRSPRYTRFRKIALIVIAVIVVLVIVALALAQLRVNYLYLSSLGHTNVFWTPLIAQVVLFLIGLVITGGLVGASVPFWARAVRGIDALSGRITFWTGIAIAVLAVISVVGIAYLLLKPSAPAAQVGASVRLVGVESGLVFPAKSVALA